MKHEIVIRINMADQNTKQLYHPGKKLVGKDRYRTLYHYTSFDTFRKIYDSKQLKYSEAVNMNDIMEANKRLIADRSRCPLLFALKDVIASYRQISFTMNYDTLLKGCMSNSMWYHYGDKRNGVCIEFDYDKLKLPQTALHAPISYKYLLQDRLVLPNEVMSINDVEKFVQKNGKKIFFEKTFDWKYENEYRIVCPHESFLNVENAITALYFTNCESEHVKEAEKIVGNEFPIRFIDYMTEQHEITPIDNGTMSMRMKYEKIMKKHENDKTWTQQAKEFYDANKYDKHKPLKMDNFRG